MDAKAEDAEIANVRGRDRNEIPVQAGSGNDGGKATGKNSNPSLPQRTLFVVPAQAGI